MRSAAAQDQDNNKTARPDHRKDKAVQDAVRYPLATRKEPKPKVSDEGGKQLSEISKAFAAQDFSKTRSLADDFLPKASTPYEKSLAYEIAGSAAFSQKDFASATTDFQEVITANGLDNNGHYDSMSNLVASLSNSGKYPEALKVLDQFLAETKTTDKQYADMRLSLLAHTGNAGDAVAAYKQRLAKDPNDRAALQNLLATYQQGNNNAEMLALLRDRYKQNLLTTPEDLRYYYIALLQNSGTNWKEAQEVLDSAVAKGTLPKNDQTATAYSVVAQSAFAQDQWNIALADYAKAASMSTTGDADLNRARILAGQGKKADAKAAAQEALKKGVKDPAAAQRFLK
ncbi:tetratricopeptide repeat protein [Solilutibacter silvestris]|nr:tetratricopeptide repeat protein [Lysobacter silvestris]